MDRYRKTNRRGRALGILVKAVAISMLISAVTIGASLYFQEKALSELTGEGYEIIVSGEEDTDPSGQTQGPALAGSGQQKAAAPDSLPEVPGDAQRAFETLKGGHELSSGTGTDGKAIAQDASERNQYAIDLVLHAPTEPEQENGCSMQQLHQVMSFRNTSGEVWPVICLRDYTEMHLAAARGSSRDYGWDSVFENVVDLRTGTALSPRRDSNDLSVVWIDLEQPLKPGEEMQLALDFRFPILSEVESGCRATFGYTDSPGWFEKGGKDPVLALGNFYPVLAAWLEDGWDTAPNIEAGGECFLSPVADYSMTVAAPAGWMAAVSGPETEVEQAGLDGCQVWQVREQEVRDIAVVAGKGLARKQKTLETEGVTVVATYYKQHEKMADLFLEAGAVSVQAFTEAYGKFPYSSLDVTECALFAGGMEYPELVLISDQLFWYFQEYEDGYTTPMNSELAVVTAHEVGHNWFYAAVGNDEYREAWLDESFASYSEHVYRKYISDHALGDRYDWAEGEAETWDLSRGHDRYIDLPANEMKYYQTTVYPYGCYFLMRLRRCMGDEQFTKMMHEYYETYCLKVADTRGFLNILLPYIYENPGARRLCQVFLSTYSGK